MTFWDKFKFKKQPFKKPREEEREIEKMEEIIEKGREKDVDTQRLTEIKKEKAKEKKIKNVSKSVKEEQDQKGKKIHSKNGKGPNKVEKDDTGDSYRILIKPIISEKVTSLGDFNQYVFEVAPRANKNEIKKAVFRVYGVMPNSVRIIKKIGKKVRFGRKFGKLKDRKKAIVTLRRGETIQIYEGI